VKLLAFKILVVAAIIAILCGLGYLSWRVERWANWRFSYGPRLEGRLLEVERRLDALERKR